MRVTRLRVLLLLLFTLIMLILLAPPRALENPRGLADTPWPMFMHDPQHTGRSPYLGAQANNTKWRFWTGGWIVSSPAIGYDGTIYVGSHDNYTYALNPDGSVKWRYETGHMIDSSPAIGSDGTIYMGSNDGCLYAIGGKASEGGFSIFQQMLIMLEATAILVILIILIIIVIKRRRKPL